MLNGIDVSHWNGIINWNSVIDEDYKYVFIKASEGSGWKDYKFLTNWQGAKEVGLSRGAYHFYRYAYDPVLQAENLYGSVKQDLGELPPVLDLEDTRAPKGGDLPRKVKECLNKIEELFERKPIIYTGAWWFNAWMVPTPSWCNEYDLWTAHYTTANEPRKPRGWDKWLFWQYTSSGSVQGISGRVDLNRFNGTEQEFNHYCGGSHPSSYDVEIRVPKEAEVINVTILREL